MKYIIVIDMQNDFISGSLANKAASNIVSPMADFLVSKQDDYHIIFTQDTHSDEDYLHTQEGKFLPIKHCIYGTIGCQVNSLLYTRLYFDRYDFVSKNTFGYVDWKKVLEKPEEIILVGTCTDICVVSNALILKALYPEVPIKVIEDLCAGTTGKRHREALDVMKSCQIEIWPLNPISMSLKGR